jgi:hypothetical protein
VGSRRSGFDEALKKFLHKFVQRSNASAMEAWGDSPRVAQNLADADGVEDGGAGFPIGVFDFAVFFVEGVAGVGGAFDELAGGLFVVLGDFHQHILKRVRNLAEYLVDDL